MSEEKLITILAICIAFVIVNGFLSIIYIKLFKTCKIKHTWLAFIPIIRNWLALELIGIPGGWFIIMIYLCYLCGSLFFIPLYIFIIIFKIRFLKAFNENPILILLLIFFPFISYIYTLMFLSHKKDYYYKWNKHIFIKDDENEEI